MTTTNGTLMTIRLALLLVLFSVHQANVFAASTLHRALSNNR